MIRNIQKEILANNNKTPHLGTPTNNNIKQFLSLIIWCYLESQDNDSDEYTSMLLQPDITRKRQTYKVKGFTPN